MEAYTAITRVGDGCVYRHHLFRSGQEAGVRTYLQDMATRVNPTLRDVSDAVLAVTAELSVEEVLQKLVDAARELASARYAALGLPDGEGGFRQFLTSGMSEE